MRGNKTLKHIIIVTASNAFAIISGIVVGFLVPKILTVEGYGYYKTFALYLTYAGFFGLGLNDGIVLEYGGRDYNSLDKRTFRSYFKWFLFLHIIASTILIILSFKIEKSDIKFILITYSLYMIAQNITGYYQQISQITQRFKEYSLRKILQSILNILLVSILYCIYVKNGDIDYKIYMTALTFLNVVLAGWYLCTYKEITFGKCYGMLTTSGKVFSLMKTGLPLLFANLCSTLLFTLDRQFVNMFFDTSTYAVYAFAYNMLSLVTVATSAISTVLYPTLKRTKTVDIKNEYTSYIGIILLFVYGTLIVYFPLVLFIKWFLPKYVEALMIFRIIFPGLAISSTISVVMHNYYKVLGENITYFKKCVVVLLISIITNVMALFMKGTPEAISMASIITMIIWYLYVEEYFVKKYAYSRGRNLSYLCIMLAIFYFVSGISSIIIGMVCYAVMYFLVTGIFYKKTINKFVKRED